MLPQIMPLPWLFVFGSLFVMFFSFFMFVTFFYFFYDCGKVNLKYFFVNLFW